MSEVSALRAEHEARFARWTETFQRAGRASSRLGNGRLLLFFATLVGGLAVLKSAPGYTPWLALPLAGFGVLVWQHGKAAAQTTRARAAVALYARALRRLSDDWLADGPHGSDLPPADHPGAADLDLFGKGSLFQRLATGRSRLGQGQLARWLLDATPVEQVLSRQAAVAELAPDLNLFERLALLDSAGSGDDDPSALPAWAASDAPALPAWERALAGVLASMALLAMLAWGTGLSSAGPVGLVAVLAALLGRLWARRHGQVSQGALAACRSLPVLAGTLAELEQHPAQCAELARLKASLATPEGPPSEALGTLARLTGALEDATRNPFWAPLAFLAQRRVFLIHRLDAWRRRVGPSLPAWIEAAARFEALTCLATWAREHVGDPFPSFVDGPPRLEGQALVHPLLPRAQAVANDVSLGPDCRLLLVSGSNMSGKTTFLRTLGCNLVLARAGATVTAASLTLTPLALGASIRSSDSLLDGVSRFYAEVQRMAALDQLARNNPGALLLLDEIMSGTNSKDRLDGTRAYVGGLLARDALVLVTTHDLALTQLVDELPQPGRNVHFTESVHDGEMVFDYQMRQGVVEHGNALRLMRALGLDV